MERVLHRIWNGIASILNNTCAHIHMHHALTHLLTPPPPPPHTHKHTHTQTYRKSHLTDTSRMHMHVHTHMHTHATSPHPTQYICNHEGMIIFSIRYSNIATQKFLENTNFVNIYIFSSTKYFFYQFNLFSSTCVHVFTGMIQ